MKDASSGYARWVMAVLLLGTLLLFARAVGHDFVNYDDPDYVTENSYVKAGLTKESLGWAFFRKDVSYWHPLTWVSHMADWQFFKAKPYGHHATSVLWHALNAVLAFAVFRRLTGNVGTSAVAAALFAWHPLRVESVAWVSERKDVLSGFFWLAALWAYSHFAEERRGGTVDGNAKIGGWSVRAVAWYAATLLLFLGGLMSKPMLVTLPAILLILDAWPLRRLDLANLGWRVLEKVPFFALSAWVSLKTIEAQRDVGTLSDALGIWARLGNAGVSVVRYLGKFFVPIDLAPLYPHPGYWAAAKVVLAFGFIGVVTGVAVWQWRRRSWLLAGWAWFLVALLPVSGVKQVGIQAMADRYTYLPILGIELALLWTIRDAWVRPTTRSLWAWGAATVLLIGAARTWHQIGYWSDSYTLFDHTVKVTQNNYLAHNNRGLALWNQGRHAEAIADYQASVAIFPAYADSNSNLGHALARQGRPAEAIPFYLTALTTKPNHLEIRNNLGNALSDVGRLDEAIAEFEFVLARNPRHLNALNGYGVTLAMKGKLPEARQRLEEVLKIDPQNLSGLSNLGNVCAMSGQAEQAEKLYRRALAIAPDDERTHINLGHTLIAQGKGMEAAASYAQAVRFGPNNPDAHASLGFVLAQLGRRDEGLRHLQAALRLQPQHAQARAWLQAVETEPVRARGYGR